MVSQIRKRKDLFEYTDKRKRRQRIWIQEGPELARRILCAFKFQTTQREQKKIVPCKTECSRQWSQKDSEERVQEVKPGCECGPCTPEETQVKKEESDSD